ncbi:group-specific protein [Bacillus licheniformis]|nr:group-specific protein [Bacillus licheniformis]
MNLNRFLKTDREKAERLFISTRDLIAELPAAIEEHDFEGCVEIAATIISIKDTFFYDPRFPKYRVGKKWLFPAKECEKFLLTWLAEQPRN